jgi:uncharacterized membrane protein YccC
MMKRSVENLRPWRLGWAVLAVALGVFPACGAEDQAAAPPPAEETPASAPLSSEEQKAVSDEFDLEAEEAIDEDNMNVEVEKLEREIAADID